MVSRLLVCDALDVEDPFEVGLRADFEGVKDILAVSPARPAYPPPCPTRASALLWEGGT